MMRETEMDRENDNMDKLIHDLNFRLNRSYQKDKNGREMCRGDRITGLFLHGRPVAGVCEFSREHSAWGIRWQRGDVTEFTPFCTTCNVEWEVVEGTGHERSV